MLLELGRGCINTLLAVCCPLCTVEAMEDEKMYVSRLNFYTIPGKSGEVEQQLKDLRAMVERQGGTLPRILRTHFASLGAPDIVFEQEAPEMAALEEQIAKVTESSEFQDWSSRMSTLLMQSPKREVYLVVE